MQGRGGRFFVRRLANQSGRLIFACKKRNEEVFPVSPVWMLGCRHPDGSCGRCGYGLHPLRTSHWYEHFCGYRPPTLLPAHTVCRGDQPRHADCGRRLARKDHGRPDANQHRHCPKHGQGSDIHCPSSHYPPHRTVGLGQGHGRHYPGQPEEWRHLCLCSSHRRQRGLGADTSGRRTWFRLRGDTLVGRWADLVRTVQPEGGDGLVRRQRGFPFRRRRPRHHDGGRHAGVAYPMQNGHCEHRRPYRRDGQRRWLVQHPIRIALLARWREDLETIGHPTALL